MDWYESTRLLLPPPCGTDVSGNFTDFFLKNASDGTPAHWPSPFCSPAGYDLNYNFSQPQVVDYYVNHIALALADSENLFGVWFDDSDWLACHDMCNEVHGIHFAPCDLAAKERLVNDATVTIGGPRTCTGGNQQQGSRNLLYSRGLERGKHQQLDTLV